MGFLLLGFLVFVLLFGLVRGLMESADNPSGQLTVLLVFATMVSSLVAIWCFFVALVMGDWDAFIIAAIAALLAVVFGILVGISDRRD